MKCSRQLYAVILLLYGLRLQAESTEVSIPFYRNFNISGELSVSASQQSKQQSKSYPGPFGYDDDGETYYFLDKGPVTITVNMKSMPSKTFGPWEPQFLLGKKIFINAKETGGSTIYHRPQHGLNKAESIESPNYKLSVDLQPNKLPPPPKEIHAYPTFDEKADWTILVTNEKGTEVDKKTFKKTTSQKTTEFLLRINHHKIADTTLPMSDYNTNTIKMFKGKQATGSPVAEMKDIIWSQIEKQKWLEITPTRVKFVDANPFKLAPKKQKITKAYKTEDRTADWTVLITDKNDNEISHSTFKKNSKGVGTKSLYVQLNNPPAQENASDYIKRYNENKIKVFKGKQTTGNPIFNPVTINATNFATDKELQITKLGAQFVEAGQEPK